MTMIAGVVDVNPFPGLRPFESEEEHLFFGRETQVDELLGRLRRTRFLAVVGTSGSGKSSLVRAGMLPALNGGLMAGAGSRWRIALLRPGSEPLDNLARALTAPAALGTATDAEHIDSQLPVGLARAALGRGALGLVETVQQARLDPDENVLIVIDQFEEVFRFKGGDSEIARADEATAFVKLLLAAASHAGQSIFVALTMRSDFLGDCAQFRDLPETINDGLFLVPRMTRAELRSAIAGPIGVAGGRIAPRLVTRLLNDLDDDPDQLPVLQHALMRTWNIWENDHATDEPIDLRHYEATGGMGQALSLHADEVYAALPDDRARKVAERLFKCLTDTGGDKRGVRRPLRFREACAVVGASAREVQSVVDAFRATDCSFLMPPAGTSIDDDTVLDISHESLMRVWKRLQEWVEAEAQSAQTYRRIAESALLQAQGHAGLMRDPELSIALRWREETLPNGAWAQRYNPSFVEAMRFLENSDEARGKEELDRDRARRREARGRYWRWSVVVLTAFVCAMGLAVVAAISEKAKADHQADVARAERRIAKEEAAKAEAATSHALLKEQQSKVSARIAKEEAAKADAEKKKFELLRGVAVRAFTEAKQQAEIAKVERKNAESQAALATRQAGIAERQRQIANFRAQQLAAQTVELQKKTREATREQLRADEAESRILSRILARDSRTAVERGDAVFGILLALAALPTNLSHPNRPFVNEAGIALESAVAHQQEISVLRGHKNEVWCAAFSPDGKRIVSASQDKTVRVWDSSSGAQIAVLEGHTDGVGTAAFSPDGRRIVSASKDKTVRVWDAASGVQLAVLRGHEGPVWSAAFSPDGRRIVSASADKTIRIWDATSGAQIAELTGHDDAVGSAVFSPEGRRIVSASHDKTVRVWDAASGVQIAVLRGHDDVVEYATFSPDGQRVVSASWDKTVRVWNAESGASIAVLRGHEGNVEYATFSPDGRRIVSASLDNTVRIWDLASGVQVATLSGHEGGIASAAFSPDGRRIVTASHDHTVRVWSSTSAAELAVLGPQNDSVTAAAFSPDGRRIISFTKDHGPRVWDATSGSWIALPGGHEGHASSQSSASFSADGRRIVSASADEWLHVWDAASGALISEFRGADGAGSPALSPDGRHIVGSFGDGTVRVWDARGGTETGVFKGHEVAPLTFPRPHEVVEPTSPAFSPDGRRIVSAQDQNVRVFDVSSGAEIAILRGHEGKVSSVAFSPDSRRIVSASSDETVRVWDATTGAQLAVLRGHQEFVFSAAFSPDGRRVVSASGDRTVRVWDVSSGTQIAVLRGHSGPVTSAQFSADGRRILSTSDDDVRLWSMPPCDQSTIDAARRSVPRQLSEEQRKQVSL